LTQKPLLQLADQCVKCGYCLPHCPTFRLRQDEAESPRGRVALIQGLLSGELDDGGRLSVHLGNCLECLACEPACPSLVQFGLLMDGARAYQVARLPRWRRGWLRLRLALLAHRRTPSILALLSRFYRMSGVASMVMRLGLARRGHLAVLHGLLLQVRPPWSWSDRVPHKPDPHVGLFMGCVARGLQRPTAEATLRVLQTLGFSVRVPPEQRCCGAMHRHNGHPDTAEKLLETNRQAFARQTVVGFSSACVAELRQGLDGLELCRFLVDSAWPASCSLRPLPALVAVHEPCSHRNLLRDTDAVYQLLARIPELRVVGLDGNDSCCGAAGTFLLDRPDTALALAADKVKALAKLGPRYLLTTNTGCAAHLVARLRDAGIQIEVLHPIELIARQLVATSGIEPSAPRPT
jgi:glycolate oxidase iron-sulfur subunit